MIGIYKVTNKINNKVYKRNKFRNFLSFSQSRINILFCPDLEPVDGREKQYIYSAFLLI